MVKFIRDLFGLCEHKWEVIEHTIVKHGPELQYTAGHKYYLQCEKCGNIKVKTL